MGAVRDKHDLMAAAVGENNKVPGEGGALQADLLLRGGQAIGFFLEGEGVRVHMALHNRLISNTSSRLVRDNAVRGARSALLPAISGLFAGNGVI